MPAYFPTDLAYFDAQGADAATFLQNLLSSQITHLPENGLSWSSFNTPKGRTLSIFLVWRIENGFRLALPRDIAPGIVKKLRMYVLRSKVSLSEPVEQHLFACLGSTNIQTLGEAIANMHWAQRDEGTYLALSQEAYLLCTPTPPAGLEADPHAFTQACIQAGWPWVSTSTQDLFIPQMLNLDLLEGVCFNKGCYPGQEVIARTKYLGKLKKRTCRARAASQEICPPGTELFAPEFGEQAAGHVVLCAPHPAGGIQMLISAQISALEAQSLHLQHPEGPPLSIENLPYTPASNA